MKRSIVLAGLVLVLAGAAAAQAHPGGPGGFGGPGGAGGAGGPMQGPRGGEMGGEMGGRGGFGGPRGGEQAGDGATDAANDAATDGESAGRRGPRGRRGHGPAQALLRAADADDSKSVTADEFAAFLDGLITDENGAVDLADLATKLPAPREGFPEDADALAEMLTRGFDVDGDGVVTKADLQAIFDKGDADGDGVVGGGPSGGAGSDGDRLRGRDLRCGKALIRAADADESKDVTAEEWTAFLDAFAVDDAGAIALADLAAVLPAPRGAAADDTEKRDAALLRAYDRDGDGVITRDDLQAVFDALDRNADGAIDRSDATRRAR